LATSTIIASSRLGYFERNLPDLVVCNENGAEPCYEVTFLL
jgi:hypothetical protein